MSDVMAEMQKTNKELCRGCIYSIIISGSRYACDYMDKAKQRRNCPVGWCNKYEPKIKKRKIHMKPRGSGIAVEAL